MRDNFSAYKRSCDRIRGTRQQSRASSCPRKFQKHMFPRFGIERKAVLFNGSCAQRSKSSSESIQEQNLLLRYRSRLNNGNGGKGTTRSKISSGRLLHTPPSRYTYNAVQCLLSEIFWNFQTAFTSVSNQATCKLRPLYSQFHSRLSRKGERNYLIKKDPVGNTF